MGIAKRLAGKYGKVEHKASGKSVFSQEEQKIVDYLRTFLPAGATPTDSPFVLSPRPKKKRR